MVEPSPDQREDLRRPGAPRATVLLHGAGRAAPQPTPQLLLQQGIRHPHHAQVRAELVLIPVQLRTGMYE